MTQPERSDELDPELEAWLAEARQDERAPSADVRAMLEGVESRIAAQEGKPSFWLRSRSTLVRRGAAGLAAAIVVGLGGVATGMRDLETLDPVMLVVSLSALGVLLGLSVFHALRPLHQPPLAPWARATTVALTLGATLLFALFPPGDAHVLADGPSLLEHVSPCLFYGLLLGLPVYLVLRLFDRGSGTAPLLAACAAGLAGNLVLELHCPRNDLEHLMLSHFMVAVVFVAGLGLVHVLSRARR